MDQDTFTKIVATLHQMTGNASELAAFVVVPLMLVGIVCGFLLTRWIFRGGLSRSGFQARD
jgi:high-affinity Fe2+/Pb2+ permease